MMVIDHPPPPSPPSASPPRTPVRSGADAPACEAPRRAAPRRRAALWAVFGLEFRPFVPLAVVLLLIAFCLAGLLAWNGGKKQFWIDLRESNVLFISGLQVLLAIGCAAVGVILGVCQARAWTSADQWGLLKHRPAGAGLMFAGRALAGLALYGIAAGIPVALLLITAARGVPFEWHFVLPTIVYLLVGLAFYLAGILVIQRQASFFGTRLLPLLGVIALSLAVHEVVHFWQALLAVSAGLLLYGWAAMGAHSSNGFRLRAPRFSRAALGVLLAASFSAALVIAAWNGEERIVEVTSISWERKLLEHRAELAAVRKAALPSGQREWASYTLLPDGTLGRKFQREVLLPDTPDRFEIAERYERLGTPETPYVPRVVLSTNDLGPRVQVFLDHFPNFFNNMWKSVYSAVPYADLYATQVKEEPDGSRWWFVQPARIYQRYDAAGNYQGSLGGNVIVAGHKMRLSGLREYSIEPDGTRRVGTEQGIFKIDLRARSITPERLFPGRRILGYVEIALPIAVGEDRLYVYEDWKNPSPTREVPLDFRPNADDIRIAQVPDVGRWAVWHGGQIDLYDRQWQKASQIQVPGDSYRSLQAPDPPEWYVQMRQERVRDIAWRTGILHAACNPLFLLAVDWQYGHRPFYRNYVSMSREPWIYGWYAVDPEFWQSPWYGGAMAATVLASAAGMWLLARRYDARLKSLWILGALIFGPVMLLLLAALHTLPRRAACPKCGKKSFLHAERCPHCGASTSSPVPNGTEIFTTTAGGTR